MAHIPNSDVMQACFKLSELAINCANAETQDQLDAEKLKVFIGHMWNQVQKLEHVLLDRMPTKGKP